MIRHNTKEITIGNQKIGGDNPILIQSMTNTKTNNIEETIKQIKRLENAGCDIIRVAVPDLESAKAIKDIKKEISIPIVGDIHFNYKLALEAINSGVDKIRINPGNIGKLEYTQTILEEAKKHNIPIRIGVNSGSIEKDLIKKNKGNRTQSLVESALNYQKIAEDNNFNNLVFSLKASSVKETIEANRLFSQKSNNPLHLGVTEAGLPLSAIIKSSIGIGSLLNEGIGDTFRVSITGDPVQEIQVAEEILNSLDLGKRNKISIISCPTCGRTNIDLIKIAQEVEERTRNINKNLKIAVMGCPVNGPGEAKDADLGIAGGDGIGLLFKKGEIIRKVPENKIIDALLEEIDKL